MSSQTAKIREEYNIANITIVCIHSSKNESVLESTRSSIEHSDVGEVTWISRPEFFEIPRIIFPLTIYQDVLVAPLKTSTFDNFTLERNVAETFSEKILSRFSFPMSSVACDWYHNGFWRSGANRKLAS